MMAPSDFQSYNNLQNFDTPALMVAQLIEDEILTPLKNFNRFNPFSDLNKLISQKIKEILESITPEIHDLSSRFWNKPLEDPVINEEVISALVLNFLSGMHNSRKLEKILYALKSSRFQGLANILKGIIASNELKSFNISVFIIFTDFKYPENLSPEVAFWMADSTAKIKNFNYYFDTFMEFLTWNPLFKEYMKGLCKINEDDFENLLIAALRNTVLVQQSIFVAYRVDGFTSYDRKIYLKLFKTGYPEMDKAATFYVLLHELCHYFGRISCRTWENSRNLMTSEEIISNPPIGEEGIFFEIKYFGETHKFLNAKTCKFFLTPNHGLSQEKYLKKFVEINESKGWVYVSLMRETCLRGCLISRYRGYK